MAEELQSLLERIQKDGVQKAEAEAARLLEQARLQADNLEREAQDRAKAIVAKAERESAAFFERSRRALQQAGRDVVLSVAQSLNDTLSVIVRRDVSEALDAETLKRMLARVVDAYCTHPGGNVRIDILVPPALQREITAFFMDRYAEQMRHGLEIRGDTTLHAGFRVSFSGGNMQHDFSSEAIADALSQLLRPELAQIVQASRTALPPTKG